MKTILNGFEEEDAEAAKEGLNRPCIKDLDIEFTRMVKKIKLPDSGDLEAAAANFGAQRAAILASATPSKQPGIKIIFKNLTELKTYLHWKPLNEIKIKIQLLLSFA
jgi:hypothetical protein